jgi:hypothetical protein
MGVEIVARAAYIGPGELYIVANGAARSHEPLSQPAILGELRR